MADLPGQAENREAYRLSEKALNTWDKLERAQLNEAAARAYLEAKKLGYPYTFYSTIRQHLGFAAIGYKEASKQYRPRNSEEKALFESYKKKAQELIKLKGSLPKK